VAKVPRSVVLGTAGHIDHGKTTLVRALTGRDTDRLPEEKRRGITIELGFAPWVIAEDLEASIVDVPGHESFVRTMVAGAGGIDAVILVVSAEDGVMPQTREHINVCRLLGVEHGVVALTKVDRLEGDAEAIELAVDDVHEALQGTVFENAPIIACSGHSGEGLDALRTEVRRLVASIPRRETRGDPLIPLDRVFTMKGHGTVVTGTLLRGVIDLGRESTLRLEPMGEHREPRDVRARAAQVRGAERDRILAGSRIALNVAGVDTKEIARGDVLTAGATVLRSSFLHALLDHLPGHSAPWKHGTTVQVCAGTASTVGRLDPLWRAPSEEPQDEGPDRSDVVVPPGRRAIVRVRLEAPLPVWRDQRVIVRAFDDPTEDHQGRTIGGGFVIDPEPGRGRGQRPRWIALGRALLDSDARARVLALLRDAGTEGARASSLARRAGVRDLGELVAPMTGDKGEVIALSNERFVHASAVQPLIAKAITVVDRFHADNPMQPGLGRAAVEGLLGSAIAPDVAALAVDRAIARGALKVVDDHGTVARPGKGLQPGGELPEHMQRVLDLYVEGGTAPPTLRQVEEGAMLPPRQILEIVGILQRTGRLIKVTPDLSFSKQSHERLLEQVRERLREHGTIDVQALKQMTGLSRKFVVPFLEHLDQLQITLRQGDTRIPGPRAQG
jgi:selenocysteine-specific elongation factor